MLLPCGGTSLFTFAFLGLQYNDSDTQHGDGRGWYSNAQTSTTTYPGDHKDSAQNLTVTDGTANGN
jgi:hypothetical protein